MLYAIKVPMYIKQVLEDWIRKMHTEKERRNMNRLKERETERDRERRNGKYPSITWQGSANNVINARIHD